MHEKYQAEFYTNEEHLKNIAQRESGDKKEATPSDNPPTNNEVKILNEIKNRSEQNKANNGAVRLFQKNEDTLFDKLANHSEQNESTQTQSEANNGVSLFDKINNLNVSNNTKRAFSRIIIPNKKQS